MSPTVELGAAAAWRCLNASSRIEAVQTESLVRTTASTDSAARGVRKGREENGVTGVLSAGIRYQTTMRFFFFFGLAR